MKKSNKLLLGLFAAVVVLMIVGNIMLKNKAEALKTTQPETSISSPDTVSNISDTTTVQITK